MFDPVYVPSMRRIARPLDDPSAHTKDRKAGPGPPRWSAHLLRVLAWGKCSTKRTYIAFRLRIPPPGSIQGTTQANHGCHNAMQLWIHHEYNARRS